VFTTPFWVHCADEGYPRIGSLNKLAPGCFFWGKGRQLAVIAMFETWSWGVR
jgi:hypothetical protein